MKIRILTNYYTMIKKILTTAFCFLTLFANAIGQEPQAGESYSYIFGNNIAAEGSAMPQDPSVKHTTFTTADGLLTINKNSGDAFWYHDVKHGIVVYNNNTFEIKVAGNAIVTFNACNYSADNSSIIYLDKNEATLGTTEADNNNGGEGDFPITFAYNGSAGVLTAKIVSSGAVYFHSVEVENAADVGPKSDKTDVWDFGAEQLDTDMYNNQLTVDIINDFYPASVERGSTGNNFVSTFAAGVLSWSGGTNDRLRTTNENLTRKDEQNSGGTEYKGRLYVNAAAQTGRYLSLTLSEDDEVQLVTLTQSGSGQINFQYVADPDYQTDVEDVGSSPTVLSFVAKRDGTYRIFDTVDKPSYFRVYRKDAIYASISGSLDVSAAPGIPAGYGIVFTNQYGKIWNPIVSNSTYYIDLPIGYTYTMSLSSANGYVISNGETLEVSETTSVYDITIERVELNTVSGSINGLSDQLPALSLGFTPDPAAGKVFIPDAVINAEAGTYTVEVEPNVTYTIDAEGVNDFTLTNHTMNVTQNETINLEFEAKPVYPVTIDGDGLNDEQVSKLQLTFSNLNEPGYEYAFTSIDDIELRDGTYAISYDGLDDYAVEMGLTSNLTVNGDATSKTIYFERIQNWPFNDRDITTGTVMYKGLILAGGISNEKAKGHLVGKAGATVKVPVNPGDKIQVTYYYTADFNINGGQQYFTESKSTGQLEYADYLFEGFEPGFVTITFGNAVSTSYITNIAIGGKIAYSPVLYVGEDKEYKTINEALIAIRTMVRTDERVVIEIDPGNYEEMLEINSVNVTLKNASDSPGIGLINKGVEIEDNAVRITSYYGHGYNYYSMGDNQKWNSEVLRVNKENGYLSYENTGSGKTNGSYWNATVIIGARGFEAEGIIFENSFNQYISKKESEDIVEEWNSGGKGTRPTEEGNTSVQNRSYVERAAAIAIKGGDKIILSKCRVVGRQDSFYGEGGSRAVIYKGAMMGAVDYIFGGMIAVFYKTDLVMNTSDASGDEAYLTAAQHQSGRGYLMYECNVTSPVPGIETASANYSKPGYFGRPWEGKTSEVVFYKTNIEQSQFPGAVGKSLIIPLGWQNTLGGPSEFMYEYGTTEESGENNQSQRASWSTVLSEPKLKDGTEISTFNFTKGNDGWDPIPELIAKDGALEVKSPRSQHQAQVYAFANHIYIANLNSGAIVNVYNLKGSLVKTLETKSDISFEMDNGLWVVNVITAEGQKSVKVIVR